MHRSVALLFACGLVATACGAEPDAEEDVAASEEALTTQSYAGGVVVLGSALSPGDDDANWTVNMPDSVSGDHTRLTATLTHDGLLNDSMSYNPIWLDHMAIGIRGLSVDAAFQQMGFPLQAGHSFYGEEVQRKFRDNEVSLANLDTLTAGRGITIWPARSSNCPAADSRPCVIFENYLAGGLVCANGTTANCSAVARGVSLTSGPFNVTISADDWDVRAIVSQGISSIDISCRAITRTAARPDGDSRCSGPPGPVGDAFIANVVRSTPSPQRRLGATNITVTVRSYIAPQCNGCQLP